MNTMVTWVGYSRRWRSGRRAGTHPDTHDTRSYTLHEPVGESRSKMTGETHKYSNQFARPPLLSGMFRQASIFLLTYSSAPSWTNTHLFKLLLHVGIKEKLDVLRCLGFDSRQLPALSLSSIFTWKHLISLHSALISRSHIFLVLLVYIDTKHHSSIFVYHC